MWRKQKLIQSRIAQCSKDYLFWYQYFVRFRQVFILYVMYLLMICQWCCTISDCTMQISLRCDLFRKVIDQKNSFYSNKWLSCISCSMVCKIFFCFEFPDILEMFGIRRRNWQFQSVMLYKLTQKYKSTQK